MRRRGECRHDARAGWGREGVVAMRSDKGGEERTSPRAREMLASWSADDQVLRVLADAAAERLGDCGMVFAEPQPLVDDEPAHIR